MPYLFCNTSRCLVELGSLYVVSIFWSCLVFACGKALTLICPNFLKTCLELCSFLISAWYSLKSHPCSSSTFLLLTYTEPSANLGPTYPRQLYCGAYKKSQSFGRNFIITCTTNSLGRGFPRYLFSLTIVGLIF